MQGEEGDRPLRAGYQGKSHIVYEDVNVFSLSQRLNRLRYCCYQFTGALVLALVAVLLVILAQAVPPLVARILFGIVVIFGLAYVVWAVGLMVRRLHDTGRVGTWALLILVPGINFLLMLYLLVAASDNGMNRFGTPPPPNSIIVAIVGGIYWFLQVMGSLFNLAAVLLILLAPGQVAKWQQEWMPPGMAHHFQRLENRI